jgi:hypothetical protein
METKKLNILEMVNNRLSYDPESGVLLWKNSKYHTINGSVAGTIPGNRKKKYIFIRLGYKNYSAHRLAWLISTGEFPNGQIDHIDGNGLNNAISNLRVVTNQENQKNRRLSDKNKSGMFGVRYISSLRKWKSEIWIDGRNKYLGLFADFNSAASARKSAENKYGYHANHGKPTAI